MSNAVTYASIEEDVLRDETVRRTLEDLIQMRIVEAVYRLARFRVRDPATQAYPCLETEVRALLGADAQVMGESATLETATPVSSEGIRVQPAAIAAGVPLTSPADSLGSAV